MDEQPTVRQAVPTGHWQGEVGRRRAGVPEVPEVPGAPEFDETVRIAAPLQLPPPQLPSPMPWRRRLPDGHAHASTGYATASLDEGDGQGIPWGSLLLVLSAFLVLVALVALPFAGPYSPSAVGLLIHGKAILLLITAFAAAAVLVVALFSLIAPPRDGSGRAGSGFACFLAAIAAAYPLYEASSAPSSQVHALGGGFWLCAVGVAGMVVGSLTAALNIWS